MKRVCIHQPDFVPYLGFFHRLLHVDTFIILDDVQFVHKGRGWHNRDKIKTPRGEQWITLSVENGPLHRNINEVRLSSQKDWIDRNVNLLAENYRKAAYYSRYYPELVSIYQQGYERMLDLNMAFLKYFFEIFDIHVPMVFSSDLAVGGTSNEKVIRLVKEVDGTHYLSGLGARDYMDERLFQEAQIVVEWQKFTHPVYPQLHGDFIPNLSCLDVLLNCGPGSKEILRSCPSEKQG